MDRRPPNPRRLSRKLFKDKPSITPVDTKKTPKYLLGKEVKITPLRSDIKGITVREGEDFVTYDLWRKAKAEGKVFWYGGSSYEDYLNWRDDAELPDRTNQFAPKGSSVKQKKEFGERARDVVEDVRDEVFSLSEKSKKQIAKQLLDKRKSMTRAQQRKLGRVIRDGKTNPIPRFREKDGRVFVEKGSTAPMGRFKETKEDISIDELHQDETTYDVGKEQHIKPVRGAIEYYQLKPEIVKTMPMEDDESVFPRGHPMYGKDLIGVSTRKQSHIENINEFLDISKDNYKITPAERKRRIRQLANELPTKLRDRYTKESIPFVGKADLKKKLVELESKDYTLHPEMFGDSSIGRDERKELMNRLSKVRPNDPSSHMEIGALRLPPRPAADASAGWRRPPKKSKSETYFDTGVVKAADKEDLPLFTATLGIGGRRKLREKLISMDEDWEKHPDYGGKGAELSFYKEGQLDPKFLVDGKGNFEGAMNVKKIKKVKKETKKYGKYQSKLEDKLDENRGWTQRGNQLVKTKYSRRYRGPLRSNPKRHRVIRTRLGSSALGNPDFQLRVARGGGRRIFHTAEAKTKGWKEVSKNKFTKQADNWKSLDVDSTPASQLQLRGLRDRRTGGGRLLGRGIPNPRRMDRSKEYKSARQEALVQMRINESATVKDVRRSEALKALNLRLAKETAEKTAEGLKAKNAGLTHSYNVNVRNQTAATLIGSSPDELKKIVKRGGGLSLIKTMIRKGEISDISVLTGLAEIDPATIREGRKGKDGVLRGKNLTGSKYISNKQMDALVRLFNEGGEFVEGQEYFFKHRGEFGELQNVRGYLEKGGERRENLMLFRLLPSGERQRYLVKKGDILPLDDHTSVTASGKRQPLTEPRQLSMAEFDLFGEDPDGNVIDYTRRGEEIIQDPKTGVKSLVAERGAGLDEPTPRQQTVLDTLRSEEDFDLHGEPAPIGLHLEEESPSSEEGFEFGGDAPTSPPFRGFTAPQPEPEPVLDLDDVDDALGVVISGERHAPLELGGYQTGEADEIARVLGRQRSEEAEEKADDIMGEIEEELALEGLTPTVRQSDEAQAIIDSPLSLPEKEEKLAVLKEKLAQEVSILRTMSQKSPKPKSPKKEVSFADVKPEGDKLFDKKVLKGFTPSAVDSSWEKGVDLVPDELLKEDWDFTGRGGKGLTLQSRLGEGGAQEVPEGFIALYTTKHAPLGQQLALVVNEGDLYYLMRGLHKVPIRNDKGKENPITDNTLRTFFKDVIVDLRNGKKDKATNNKQLLRALEMIPAAPESDEDTDEEDT